MIKSKADSKPDSPYGFLQLLLASVTRSKIPLAAVGLAALVASFSTSLAAQWPKFPTPNVPRAADGKSNLNGPTPRTPDGKPDLSGVWENVPCRGCEVPKLDGTGVGPPLTLNGAALNRLIGLFGDVGTGVPGGLPLQPWAAELVKKRVEENSKDNPDAHCLPLGVMQFNTHVYPRKVIQTPRLVVIIYEVNQWVRQIYVDGRPLPAADADPWWNGYSTARWERDELVVETTGFRDDGWLDISGNPLTSAGKMIERFRRPSFGYLEIEVTIDDPKAYTKPFTVTVHQRIMLDNEMIEFVCIDKDAQHYIGK